LVDVFGRVAALLNSNASDTGAGKVIEGMTHQDIAAVVGASREMVSKILADLKKGGYIDVQRKKITLLKPLPKGW
jgi:CRP/FNR family cyclic AMP-dependent transcriptional regulator